MSDFLIDIPEFSDREDISALHARTVAIPNIRQLGSPDLVHLVKKHAKSVKEFTTYHKVLGIDASSSASLAAYINSLTRFIPKYDQWFGKGQLSVTKGIYCCYNAFSKMDMRVEVNIPGSVESYAIDANHKRHPTTPMLWQETYLSAILRAYLYIDLEDEKNSCLRRFNPITTPVAEEKFFDAVQRFFERGQQLGSSNETQNSTIVTNNLVQGLFKYLDTTGRYESALAVIQKLVTKIPEATPILIKLLLDMDNEVFAVEMMYKYLKSNPFDWKVLEMEAKYLMSKNELELARKCALIAVNAAPVEFSTWETLTKVYTCEKQYDNALLTLNSCPMFNFYDPEELKLPMPAKKHFPIPQDVADEAIFDEVEEEPLPQSQNESDGNRPKSNLNQMKGTFGRAYDLLSAMVIEIGWDELLRHRSNIFVMEEEYRRATSETGSFEPRPDSKPEEKTEGEIVENGAVGSPSRDAEELHANESDVSSVVFKKRLCERWLDTLFMILYENLKVYTIWKSEYNHHKAQNLEYKKSSSELESLGVLALRLHSKKEALDAFVESIQENFNSSSWKELVPLFFEKKHYDGALMGITNLTIWGHRWYKEFSPELLKYMRYLIAVEGALKIRNTLAASEISKSLHGLMEKYFEYAELFKFEGYNN